MPKELKLWRRVLEVSTHQVLLKRAVAIRDGHPEHHNTKLSPNFDASYLTPPSWELLRTRLQQSNHWNEENLLRARKVLTAMVCSDLRCPKNTEYTDGDAFALAGIRVRTIAYL